MAEKADIVGGPADGMATVPASRFVWLDVVVVKRAARTPTAGLYELRDGAYVFIGGHRSRCTCGGVHRRGDSGAARTPCPLCGTRRPLGATP